MCEAIRALVEDGRNEGLEQGLKQGLKQGLEQGIELTKQVFRLAGTGTAVISEDTYETIAEYLGEPELLKKEAEEGGSGENTRIEQAILFFCLAGYYL